MNLKGKGLMSPFIKTEAFVIRTSRYSETSLIVTLYTLKEGKVRCIAKGARRPKSPLAGKLEPLNHIEVVYIRGKSELFPIKECSITHTRMGLRENLSKISSALRILSLVDETQTLKDPHPEIFRLLADCLDAIETSSNIPAVLLFFRTGLLTASGYAPDYSICVSCGKVLKTHAGYNAAKNGFLCPDCAKKHRSFNIAPGTLAVLKKMQESKLTTAKKIKLSNTQQKETEQLFRTMFESILERKSSAARIIDSTE